METINLQTSERPETGKRVWTGRVISGLCVLFLLFDAIAKITLNIHSVEGTTQLGWSAGAVQPIGVVLLVSTVLYIIPRTSIIGAVLLTGYLGGAIATMARISMPYFFPLIFGILVWVGLYLRHEGLRKILRAGS